MRNTRRIAIVVLFGILMLLTVVLLYFAMHCRWDAATTFATLFAGILAALVILWQINLLKQQIAFSTYLDLDKEWNSEEMIEVRKAVHVPGSTEWDHSRLEGALEFLEKFALLFNLSGDNRFIYETTLGWYAARYFLFAREHGQIQCLRDLWQDYLYRDLENLYALYLKTEVGSSQKAQKDWENKCLATEEKFWEQERKN